jgi:hypothetical protein
VTKRFVQELPPTLTKPIVPFLQTVHDRMAIEIQRGGETKSLDVTWSR